MTFVTLTLAAGVALEVAVLVRVMLRPHREPASRIAWLAVIIALPLIGVLAYMMFGEVNIGRRRVGECAPSNAVCRMPIPARRLIWLTCARTFPIATRTSFTSVSISGFEPVAGNSARLMEDSNAAIASIVADIDAAKEHVHVLFYIWLTDGNGCRVADALMRAAARGVTCRAMVDNLGSRA